MSDPVTNVEIEDVLSSIRRLVSDGDKARTRDSAPVAPDVEPTSETPEPSVQASESKHERFVLTPAFMVVDNNDDAGDVDETAEDTHHDDEDAGWVEEIPAHTDADQHDDEVQSDADETVSADNPEDPLPLTDMVWDSVNDARKAGIAAIPDTAEAGTDTDAPKAASRPQDRSELVATIAELEAAVSSDVEDYEPDGSEVVAEAIAWPGAATRHFDDVQDAEEPPETASIPDLDADDAPLAFEHRVLESDPTDEQTSDVEGASANEGAKQDDYGDDDLDGLLEAGGVSLDEDALRALVSEVVREELTGPLGERITRNVRKLVRREIYRILSSQEFD